MAFPSLISSKQHADNAGDDQCIDDNHSSSSNSNSNHQPPLSPQPTSTPSSSSRQQSLGKVRSKLSLKNIPTPPRLRSSLGKGGKNTPVKSPTKSTTTPKSLLKSPLRSSKPPPLPSTTTIASPARSR
eukprot:CAMPEP_0183737142 /NCGR_PEP_ID=MMETSP0737-20130205/51133_1 /TAXON_ID=385413 /ORGANISM="Thalassiosira miniscula, Strain CCMP1093" /LENGTH=127 /DNA_ID=CAMNT_0025971351 /DNA_START=41 /DNA_END=421 /DNA_ORIENTATION=-